MRVKATIEYVGTNYAGWQVQPAQPTVQAAIEKAVHVVTGERSQIAGAGRTDAGVHAQGQVAAFEVPDGTDLYRLRASLNGLTPGDIAILDLEEVGADFDPRRDARRRTYRYTVVNARPPAPLLAERSWHVFAECEMARLARLAEAVEGSHDFSAFCAADSEAVTTRRDVYVSAWSRDGGILTYEITANAFLKQMVRILVGSMVDVALGKLAEATFVRLLEGGERTEAGRTAPPQGLILVGVEY